MKRPIFLSFAAITLDGRIAQDPLYGSEWTSKEDKTFFRSRLKEFNPDAVIVGNTTYKDSFSPLSKFNCIVLTRTVPEGVNDPHAWYDNPHGSPYRRFYLNPHEVNLGAHVERYGYQRVAVLGGAQAYSFCLKNNYLDELFLTLEPMVFGEGTVLFEGGVSGTFQLNEYRKLNEQGTLMLHYIRKD